MSESILVIEDDSSIQELIVEFLSSQGYKVDFANDGFEGISKFKQGNYDLIILDIMMPNLDGYSACKMIRKTSNVPIIFLTALNQEHEEMVQSGDDPRFKNSGPVCTGYHRHFCRAGGCELADGRLGCGTGRYFVGADQCGHRTA